MKTRHIIPFLLLPLMVACADTSSPDAVIDDVPEIVARGELRVVTIESALSYYVDGEDEMGFDYDLARNFADYLDVPLKLILANNVEDMQDKLLHGEADFAAYHLPCSKNNKEEFNFVENVYMSQPVLVQQRTTTKRLSNVTELVGREVTVKRGSKYWLRMEHLNAEQGGGITLVEAPDSLTVDGLLLHVSQGDIAYTVADNDIANLGRSYLKNLDISLAVGMPQSKAWPVRKNAPALLDTLNAWYRSIENSRYYKQMTLKYYDRNSYYDALKVVIPEGKISPFDEAFKAAAPILGWDWQLLAAIGYNESRFNPTTVSAAGALGVMQLMPRTATKFGLDSTSVYQPEANIKAAANYIKALDKMFASVEQKDERICFVLASYNAGQGHVLDAIALAKKYGADPNVWSNSVEKYFKLKSDKHYYNDEVCRYGYFRPTHTLRFIDDVHRTYERYLGVSKKQEAAAQKKASKKKK